MQTPSKLLTALALGGLLCLSSPGLAQSEGPKNTLAERADLLFDDAFEELLERRPTALSRVGSRVFYDRWDDLTPEETRAQELIMERWAERLQRELGSHDLDPQTQLSLDLFLFKAKQEAEVFTFADHDYPINQMYGIQSEIPAFLISIHGVNDRWDAEDYVLRLERLPALFAQLIDGLERREKKGVVPPRFVFDYALSDIDNLLKGYPLDDNRETPNSVYADFQSKVENLELSEVDKARLLEDGRAAMQDGWAPAYRTLRAFLAAQRERASDDDGIWKLPQGEEYYAHLLRKATTTSLTAEEIHQIGLKDVARIHREMEQIIEELGFEGDLQAFFTHLKSDPNQTYPNTDEGRQAYLAEAVAIVDRMRDKLDELFLTKPKAELEVRPVEAFREKSAGKAFYQVPAIDGSRPGIYYANLYDMNSMPKYQMEALAYHEAIPGHHMQLSMAQELEELPRFRRLTYHTPYIEGWGLYCEYLPKEIGFYEDPYSDFGRLAMELWRSARLVVDTGIHSKKWTRQQGVDYYLANTPNPKEDCQKMVDRHIVMPGQATAYKIGMIEILRLREKAKEALGDSFDIREFHEVILTQGSVPLAILEQLVDRYIEESLDQD